MPIFMWLQKCKKENVEPFFKLMEILGQVENSLSEFLIPEVGPDRRNAIEDREEEIDGDGDDETELEDIPCSYCGKILQSIAAVNAHILSNHAWNLFLVLNKMPGYGFARSTIDWKEPKFYTIFKIVNDCNIN